MRRPADASTLRLASDTPLSELAAQFEVRYTRILEPDGRARAPLPEPFSDPRALTSLYEEMLALRLFDEHPDAVREIHRRFGAFTVDEYQDVNPLQAALLDRWLGERDDLCVVGDDYQTIYAFTGASPEHLLGITRRYPHATVVRLEENYRSTPEVLELANRLATRLGAFRKTLRATRPSGPPPLART